MFKKILFGLIAVSLVFTSSINATYAKRNADIKIVHNNIEQKQAVQPEMKNGTVFVPVRAIFDALQINYTYDEKTKTVKAVQGDRSIALILNKKDAKVNGKAHQLANAVYTVNGYTFVPLRLIGETFGADISWDQATQSVKIKTAHEPKNTNTANNTTSNQSTTEDKATNVAKEPAIKDEDDFKALQNLTTKYPAYTETHLRYIILEKKDVSWLSYYLKKVNKDDIQNALELAVESGNTEAANYILTHFKSSVANTVTYYPNITLFARTYPGHTSDQYVTLEPNKQRITYKVAKTAEEGLNMIEVLVKHGYKPANVDLLAGIGGHTDIQIPVIAKLIDLGLDLNAAVPEYVTLDTKGNIRFGTVGKSNSGDVKTPAVIQAFYVVSWNPIAENLRKFQEIIRLGGSLSLLSSSQQQELALYTKDNAEFEYLYQLVSQ